MKRIISMTLGFVFLFVMTASTFAQHDKTKRQREVKGPPAPAAATTTDSKSAPKATTTAKAKPKAPKKAVNYDILVYRQNQVIIAQIKDILTKQRTHSGQLTDQGSVLARIDANLLAFWQGSAKMFQELSRGLSVLTDAVGLVYFYIWYLFYGLIALLILYAFYRIGVAVTARQYEREPAPRRGILEPEEV